MKALNFVLAALVVVSLMGMALPAAQAADPVRNTTINVLNLRGNPGAMTITYYNQDGSLATMETGYSNPQSDTILASAMNVYNPVRAASGFNGSVVIASDVEIAVVSNFTYESSAQGLGAYTGISSGAAKIYFPSMSKGNSQQDTFINIQNTGGSSASITIDFKPESGYSAITSINDTIPLGAAHTYDLQSLSQFSGVTKWVGSASVTASGGGTIAGVSITRKSTDPNAYGVYAYNAFKKGSTTVVAPLIQEANNGNRTSINCQNIDVTTATTITVDYTPEPGNPAKASETKANIGPGVPAVWVQSDVVSGSTPKFVGSARISSNPSVPLVCVINQQKRSVGRMSSYEGFDPADATSTVVLPLLQSKNGSVAKGYNYTTVNASTSDGSSTTFTLDFRPESGISDPTNQDKTGAVAIFDQKDVVTLPNKYVGGGVVTASGGATIFVVVNQNRELMPQSYRDAYSSYDGFNVTP